MLHKTIDCVTDKVTSQEPVALQVTRNITYASLFVVAAQTPRL